MNKSRIYKLTTCALMAALMCVLGPMSIPIGAIPITLTNLVLYLTVFILGTEGTLTSYVVYLLIGAVGMPVFSGFQGGLAKLAGPTGGYLVGFILMIIVSGIAVKRFKGNAVISIIGMIVGTLIAYAFGTAWFVYQMDCTIQYALTVCVYPFIPFDLIKMVIATVFGKAIRAALKKAQLIVE